MNLVCFCGCNKPVAWFNDEPVLHHVCYQQHLRSLARDKAHQFLLLADLRNRVPVAEDCHRLHHARIKPYLLTALPDSVYEFAAEVMGAPLAFNYLRARYSSFDRRHDLLIAQVAA